MMIRHAKFEDAKEVLEIYRYYVENTAVSFAYEAPALKEIEDKIMSSEGRYVYLVMEIEGRIIGYAYSTRYRERDAYDRTVEVSVYLHKDETGRGYGKMLMDELLVKLEQSGTVAVIAVISSGNEKSGRAFSSWGFTHSGHLPKVGSKFGQWYGIDTYYKIL
ncbi:MAG TPA: GNAT family N-acetyltransferase [Bacteroidales bacterium]|nr:GNAT family N-acetyltransferase [Bacteroidales bacterium]